MGTTLSGLKIKDTYQGLIKLTDNAAASGSTKELTDGVGNDLNIQVDTTGRLEAVSFVKTGGSSSQILLADGTVATSLSSGFLADDSVTHAKLENRYTASGSITTYTGAVTVDWSAATNFVMGSSLTGAIEFDFTNFKTGQVLTIHNLIGAQTITLDSNAATSETFNKLGGNDYDGSVTNALMIECISDSANAVFNYSVLTYASDTTPS